MIKKINDLLSGVPMTIVGAIFLVLSFFKINFIFDPAWITIVISGIPLVYLAVYRLIYNKGISKISSALLIVIGMIAAILIGDYFAAGEVVFIMAIGAILEDMTTEKARQGLKDLIELAPTTARVIDSSSEREILADNVKGGDILRVLAGETIPCDGIIIKGYTSIDQSVITGEYLPIDKGENDTVYCGTINKSGVIDIRATNVGENSSLKKLIELVKNAEQNKAPIQTIADKAASILVPVALMIAIVTYFVTGDIVRGVTILVVFCPCALILATPTAIMAAIGQATKRGVIIKSGNSLETMGKVNTIAFDKTGTLTSGKLAVSDIISFSKDYSEADLIIIAASAEKKSEHPLGKAIVKYADEKYGNIEAYDNFAIVEGRGIYCEHENKCIYMGNESFFTSKNIKIQSNIKNELLKLQNQGKAAVLLAINNECIGIIALSDMIRQNSADTIKNLDKLNIKAAMLTGDNTNTAKHLAKKLNIKNVYAELLPEDKVKIISELQNTDTVCMVGDGINDAPALKTADVGIAMASMGSDIAIETADIAIMDDDISKIVYVKRLSNGTVHTIKLSIAISICINFVAIVLSVLGVLNPTTGALVHNCGSCFVILIAAMLYKRKF